MSDMFLIFVSAAIVTNFVLVYFLGLCPVIGVTSRSATGLRLGLATTFVMVLASLAAWGLNFILVAAPFLRVIAFVVAIASIVQIVELFVKKTSPALYRDLGIFLPLIASTSVYKTLTTPFLPSIFLILRLKASSVSAMTEPFTTLKSLSKNSALPLLETRLPTTV